MYRVRCSLVVKYALGDLAVVGSRPTKIFLSRCHRSPIHLGEGTMSEVNATDRVWRGQLICEAHLLLSKYATVTTLKIKLRLIWKL